MANVAKQRNRLIKLLKELFQLDQPDLDFGFYKIMHAKADKVSNFLEKDLLGIIQEAFGEADEAKAEEARLAYEATIKQAEDFGAPDPQDTPAVIKAKATYDAAKDSGTNEGDVYEHLYRFFERYYDGGDFMSRRYFARETDGKAAPYSVPYDGREVYLHWANRDQYYIKTSEYLTNFTFDIAKHFQAHERATFNMPESLKMHCRITEASEGDHNNVKANDNSERFFILHEEAPIVMEDDELTIQFEYRPDPSKTGQSGIWQRNLIEAAEEKILHALTGLSTASVYNEALRTEIGEDKSKRSLLRKYINQYSARNTMDYFVHKDLGGFMRRELDFYIKNEIMRLDDIETADAPRVESYLVKIKVLRKVAGQLVTFLTQLEEFQKKIWLKKKFVTETNYCITLDKIPESFYVEIAANDKQRSEWVKLFAIDEIEADLSGSSYSNPLKIDFLKDNPFLVLDTAFFTEEFKNNLLAEIQHLDEKTDGLLIHSENFQALQIMQEKLSLSYACIYIDPPYNAKSSEILYKNTYKHSSFNSFIYDRVAKSKNLMKNSALINFAIDDYEQKSTSFILENIFEERNFISNIVVQHNPRGRNDDKFYGTSHEYMTVFAKDRSEATLGLFKLSEDDIKSYNKKDDISAFGLVSYMRTGNNSAKDERPNLFYPIYYSITNKEISLTETDNSIEILPINPSGEEKTWRWNKKTFEEKYRTEIFIKNNNQDVKLFKKRRITGAGKKPKTIWFDSKYDASSSGIMYLRKFMGKKGEFSYPKSIYTVQDALYISGDKDANILDYFAGSGTTGHAVINLNCEDKGTRKYTLVEMGNYFDEVTRPRIQKVIYSKVWKDGKPVSRDGTSQMFKYIRLETYEDALNNLIFKDNKKREQALAGNDDFRRDYMLKYWIDFETKESPSLLNIENFADPTSYKLKIKKLGTDEYEDKSIDLVETFNWLIGLHVDHIDAWRSYGANFKREEDPELPKDDNTKLILDGAMKEAADGKYYFRKVEGRICTTPGDKTNMERALIIWRKLTNNIEADNLMLDEWFKKYRLSTQDSEFDVIYVNGSNNLPNLRQGGETWKVRLIEEDFHQKMWDVEE